MSFYLVPYLWCGTALEEALLPTDNYIPKQELGNEIKSASP
jgi:hypothetical protein